MGRVTQRIRVGRIFASSRSRTAAARTAAASSVARPTTISSNTSAEAAQMAQLSPWCRASDSVPCSMRHSMRMRSPQRGFTSSKAACGSTIRPRKRGWRKRSRITVL